MISYFNGKYICTITYIYVCPSESCILLSVKREPREKEGDKERKKEKTVDRIERVR